MIPFNQPKNRVVTPTSATASITGILSVNSNGRDALLGLCIDSQFRTNRMLYLAFSENFTGGTVIAVAEGKLSASKTAIKGATVIYRTNPSPSTGDLHYGGRTLFDSTEIFW